MIVSQHPYQLSPETTWEKAVHWSRSFAYCMIFDRQGQAFPEGGFPKMILVGDETNVLKSDSIESLSGFTSAFGWTGGILAYDLKNDLEDLSSENSPFIDTPNIHFFHPTHVLIFHTETLEIQSESDNVFRQINEFSFDTSRIQNSSKARLTLAPNKQNYLKNVNQIRNHILEGDIYEMNYCMEFGLEDVHTHPLELFRRLVNRSPTPFSVFCRMEDTYVLCASPERFLKKTGDTLISQPIKGTARRYDEPGMDLAAKEALFNSEKERAENLMIVDLVRNDLARSSSTGSVHVPELFGIYSFQHWHQMISTVKGTLSENHTGVEALRFAFPMGSMTGAPKIKVMELIDKYEYSKRGIYSGALGFITPQGDFDFNVVIRSIIYDASSGRLSFSVGSAITYDSNPEHEYQECLLKASAILEVLAEANIAPDELLNLA